MKILYFGSGAFGAPTLEQLAAKHELVGVVTQPDRPAGRSRRLTPTPIAAWVESQSPKTKLYKPENVNEASVTDALRALSADAWVVIAFGQKLGQPLLADQFAINLHASLLPRWRGAAPINHAILAGDAHTGNSVITLAEKMDAGLILGQSQRAIDPATTAGELHDLLSQDGPELVERVLRDHEQCAIKPVEQDKSAVTVAPKLSKADGWVDFSMSSKACCQRIHGLNPWPGVTATIHGEAVKLLRAKSLELDTQQETGTIVDVANGVVACSKRGALKLIEVQPAGKKAMKWDVYARGRSINVGDRIESGKPR